ncbi:MAG: aryl-sulfate sulfotransferase [Bryobacterales bacterium]|nr:aryl-sulfate sulfotransferase [Bryobacterales bacterium]
MRITFCSAFAFFFFSGMMHANAMSVSLAPSVDPPALVGAVVTWNPVVSGAEAGTLWYRFRVRRIGEDFVMCRDFGPESQFDWTASEHEGIYEIEVAVRNLDTGDAATASTLYQVLPLAGSAPVIRNTNHPLVLYYSAPPCAAGSRMRVDFRGPDGIPHATPYKACQEGLTMNFYIAGLREKTSYVVNQVIDTGSNFVQGPELTAATGEVTLNLAPYKVLRSTSETGVLLQSNLSQPSLATDLNGNVIWYYVGNVSFLTRPESGGLFWGIYESPNDDPSHQIVKEFDVAGNTLLETNAARINEQLTSMGKRQISGFHHEARRMPDGKILVLADVEQILTDVQGPGPVDVIGDMILVLDKDLQVVWTWDAFDHLDTSRMATLNETCKAVGGGCPPFYNAAAANDWLHGNSLQLTPDGSILYSARHQDWVIKIDYANGSGTGDVLWRLGKDGDFQFDSDDPYPWFSHQHDANFEFDDPTKLTVFDDGNVRYASDEHAHSRGQVIQLDEQNRTAKLVLNADLGAYADALGSAHRLTNGNYHFDVGWIRGVNGEPDRSRSLEVDALGNVVYEIEAATPEYRSFRMPSLYEP